VPTGCIDSGQAMAVDGSVGIVILQNGKEQVQMNDMVLEFSELTTEQQSSAGGKGGVLAKLYQAGYRVPSQATNSDRKRGPMCRRFSRECAIPRMAWPPLLSDRPL
jgi:hypothetical protein